MQLEITKQVLAAFVRWSLAGLGAYFVKRGIIDAEVADAWMSELTLVAVGAVLLAIPFIWKYLNARFNILALIKAVQTDPPVQARALKSETVVQTEKRVDAAVSAAVADVKAEVKAESSVPMPSA